ncbi:SusC/RagA family TonB-linked outer membrane protein [Flavihumibacter petaseus]|uniref:Putative TonB-dependent receptor n=1 Tax=Flavihumibacter petaseus NBRC 106054 TaxID=1220578 RepID=A0A0E9N885_9BACT|nr:SusC/RagA family TonB-linked outer membrane protein [Flavihumibacter petaseus]GAO45595.1 putative TonB-dependent receptor [Flavihumibacter petaseus NBRC 106054]
MRKLLTLAMALMLCALSFGQTKTVTGKVTDDKGQPIPFATIKLKGGKVVGTADAQGVFKVNVTTEKALEVSSAGFGTKEVSINGVSDVNVSLQGSVMEEVIVTAGGIKTQRREIGTAATVVKGDAITAGKSVNVAGGLQGKVAGLQINNTSGGVNPNFRLVLRGQRSITGNNQALVVLDNIIVPTSVLGNLNPEDVDDVTVLNGAGAAALYGSAASNGAVIITTKKGKRGAATIRISNTTTMEQVAFYPKVQKSFGSGGSAYGYDVNGNPAFSSIENQSYGPRYDGSMRELGYPLEDGSQDSAIYQYTDERKKFWEKGLTNQTDFSVSSGDDVSTLYFSGQYATATGTTPGDKYNRTNLRLNGTRKIGKLVNLTYATSYTQNRYDITTQTSSMYNNLLNIPSWIPITKFKNWETDKYANPNGYYNPWYQNPYFSADNYRNNKREDYLTANVELRFTPIDGLDLVARQGIATRNNSNKSTVGAFDYTHYAEEVSGSKSDIPASVTDGSSYSTQLITDLFGQWRKKLGGDFSLNLIGGFQYRQDQAKYVGVGANGLVIPDLFNVSTGIGTPTATESNYLARQSGLYGDIRLGYKGYLYLHATGRNDWVSILAPENRSFFYPSVDLSFVASEAIEPIKNSNVISYLKLRAGWSKVGQVNLGTSTDYGAYQLNPIYVQAAGYPYGSQAGYTAGNGLVSDNLRPEITKGYEFGFDLNLFNDRVTSSVTYYNTKTDDQTVNTYISNTTGYSRLLMNTGQTQSRGLELTVHGTPVRTRDFEAIIGGNFTLLDNTVNNISASLPNLPIAQYSDGAGSYAVEGQAFPVIMGYDYLRDPEGRVIVDRVTGAPQKDPNVKILGTAVPKYRLGLDGNFKYKNWSLSFLFEYRGGYKVYNAGGSTYDWAGVSYRTGVFDRNRFVFPNSSYEDPNKPGTYIKNTTVTVQDGNGNAGFWSDADLNMDISSNYVTSGDFWKLREVAISYTLPASLLKKTKFIKSATVSAQGRNLFVWLSKYNYYTDPEYSDAGNDSNGIGLTGLGQTPPSRFMGGTITVTF